MISKFSICLSAVFITSLMCAETRLPDPGPSLEMTLYEQYIGSLKDGAVAARDRRWEEAVKDEASLEAYLKECRSAYLGILGTLPDRTPLKDFCTGVVRRNDFSVEKIVFQSEPGRYVTGLLFIPSNASKKHKVPVVLHMCGHTNEGKLTYSPTGEFLAENGIACFVIDPVSQGERVQLLGSDNKSLTRGPTTEHGLLSMGCYLVGRPLAARILWDNSRALDYLQTRPEIDMNHVGAVGTSGAGTQTMLLSAFDSRVSAAVVSSAVAYGFAGTGGDGCSILPGIAARRLSLTDIVMLHAPKPLMFLNGVKDYISISEGRTAYSQLKKGYDMLGSPDNVQMKEVPGNHDYYVKEKQEALVAFFLDKLCGVSGCGWSFPVELPVFSPEEFNCTATGQVLSEYKDAVSIMEENRRMMDGLAGSRESFISLKKEARRAKMRELLGVNVPGTEVGVTITEEASYGKYDFKAFRLYREGEMPVPCALILPRETDPSLPMEIWLYEGGKNALLSSRRHIDLAIKGKVPVLLADLRGFGETEAPFFIKGNYKSWNKDYAYVSPSLLLGRSVLGQRVTDLLTVLDFCTSDDVLSSWKVKVRADGELSTVAAHAAYIDSRIKDTRLMRNVRHWELYLNPMQLDLGPDIVPGVLALYDFPDLIRTWKQIKFID